MVSGVAGSFFGFLGFESSFRDGRAKILSDFFFGPVLDAQPERTVNGSSRAPMTATPVICLSIDEDLFKGCLLYKLAGARVRCRILHSVIIVRIVKIH